MGTPILKGRKVIWKIGGGILQVILTILVGITPQTSSKIILTILNLILLGFYFSYIFGNKPKTWLECGPHHSINLGIRIHAPNHVRITTPCSVHVPGRLSDGESLLKWGKTLTGGYPKPAISFQFSKTPSKWRLWRFRSTWNPKLAKPILTCRMAMAGGMFSDQFIIPFMI